MKLCLIVDDSSVIRKVAKRLLTTDAMRVVEAEDGTSALSLCRHEMPDYIILDATLPDTTQVEFLASLKTISNEQNFPMVFTLLHELDIVPIMRAKRAGAAGFLLKPFDRFTLVDRLEEQIRKAEIARDSSQNAA